MFGIWRTLLALEVVVSHMLFVPILGGYAVFSFFVLSGYLMTSIMHETYGYTRIGFLRYIENRALRLYPNYWFAILTSLTVIWWVGDAVAAHHFTAFRLPQTLAEWLQNITMIFPYFVPSDAKSILAPPTWALTIEICFYILIGLGLSKSKRSTWLWLGASILYLIVVRQYSIDNRYSYAAIAAGSLPFSVGALTWHHRVTMSTWTIDPRVLIVVRWLVFAAALLALWKFRWVSITMVALWINVALSSLIIVALLGSTPTPKLRRIDKHVGDFSYPVYLLHMQMGVIASVALFGDRMPVLRSLEGIITLALTLVLTFGLALVCTRLIDPAIERRRTRIRQHALAQVAA
jgi:peptidoglycan/LPS O-acetylase OafA/YrhL